MKPIKKTIQQLIVNYPLYIYFILSKPTFWSNFVHKTAVFSVVVPENQVEPERSFKEPHTSACIVFFMLCCWALRLKDEKGQVKVEDMETERKRVVLVFSKLKLGVRVVVGGTDYAENHFQRKCILMLTGFLRRLLC